MYRVAKSLLGRKLADLHTSMYICTSCTHMHVHTHTFMYAMILWYMQQCQFTYINIIRHCTYIITMMHLYITVWICRIGS